MTTSIAAIRVNVLRRALPVALAIGVLSVLSIRAQAAEPDQVTVSAPAVKTIGHDANLAPIEQVTVTARVTTDPVTLTTNSGVALLKDSVLEAARQACIDADPLTQDDGTCVHEALKAARPQVNALIARARSNSQNG